METFYISLPDCDEWLEESEESPTSPLAKEKYKSSYNILLKKIKDVSTYYERIDLRLEHVEDSEELVQAFKNNPFLYNIPSVEIAISKKDHAHNYIKFLKEIKSIRDILFREDAILNEPEDVINFIKKISDTSLNIEQGYTFGLEFSDNLEAENFFRELALTKAKVYEFCFRISGYGIELNNYLSKENDLTALSIYNDLDHNLWIPNERIKENSKLKELCLGLDDNQINEEISFNNLIQFIASHKNLETLTCYGRAYFDSPCNERTILMLQHLNIPKLSKFSLSAKITDINLESSFKHIIFDFIKRHSITDLELQLHRSNFADLSNIINSLNKNKIQSLTLTMPLPDIYIIEKKEKDVIFISKALTFNRAIEAINELAHLFSEASSLKEVNLNLGGNSFRNPFIRKTIIDGIKSNILTPYRKINFGEKFKASELLSIKGVNELSINKLEPNDMSSLTNHQSLSSINTNKNTMTFLLTENILSQNTIITTIYRENYFGKVYDNALSEDLKRNSNFLSGAVQSLFNKKPLNTKETLTLLANYYNDAPPISHLYNKEARKEFSNYYARQAFSIADKLIINNGFNIAKLIFPRIKYEFIHKIPEDLYSLIGQYLGLEELRLIKKISFLVHRAIKINLKHNPDKKTFHIEDEKKHDLKNTNAQEIEKTEELKTKPFIFISPSIESFFKTIASFINQNIDISIRKFIHVNFIGSYFNKDKLAILKEVHVNSDKLKNKEFLSSEWVNEALKIYHPDKGGTHEQATLLITAKKLLSKHFIPEWDVLQDKIIDPALIKTSLYANKADVAIDVLKVYVNHNIQNSFELIKDSLMLANKYFSNPILNYVTPITSLALVAQDVYNENYINAGINAVHGFSHYLLSNPNLAYGTPVYFALTGGVAVHNLYKSDYSGAAIQVAGFAALCFSPLAATAFFSLVHVAQNLNKLYNEEYFNKTTTALLGDATLYNDAFVNQDL